MNISKRYSLTSIRTNGEVRAVKAATGLRAAATRSVLEDLAAWRRTLNMVKVRRR